jgi:hypothetical protein
MNKRNFRNFPRAVKPEFIKEVQKSTYLLIRSRPRFFPRFLYLFLIKKIFNLSNNQLNKIK